MILKQIGQNNWCKFQVSGPNGQCLQVQARARVVKEFLWYQSNWGSILKEDTMGPMFMNINREKPALASPVSSRIQGRNVTWSLKGRSRYHLGKIPRLCLSSPLCRSVSFFCLCQPTVAALLALMDQITIP